MKYINQVVAELSVKKHMLHDWEKRGLLGAVGQDLKNGRFYDENQLERITFIRDFIANQKVKGINRTDYDELSVILVDKFGGLVEKKENFSVAANENFLISLYQKMEHQEKQIAELTTIVSSIPQFLEQQELLLEERRKNEQLEKEKNELQKRLEEIEKMSINASEEKKRKKFFFF